MDRVESFLSSIKNGVWDEVLNTTATLNLPANKVIDLYEHICLEFIEMKEVEVARMIINKSSPMASLKELNIERFRRLLHFVDTPYVDPLVLYNNTTKEKRRISLCKEIAKDINDAPPSKLLTLISQALRYQQLKGVLEPGTQYDLFRGKEIRQEQIDIPPRFCSSVVKVGPSSRVECAMFSPDGKYLVTGSVEGFIEVRDSFTGKLSDLSYQRENKYMFHQRPVICLNFSKDGDYIVSGSQGGEIKVWELKTGKCLRKMETAHSEGVTSVSFNKDGKIGRAHV